MILEADRMVMDWLSGATFGANAALTTVPVDAGDTAPAPFATIADETRNGTAARNEPAQPYPSLTVSVDSVTDLDGRAQVVTADGIMKFRIRAAVENAATADAIRDVSYYLRAVMRSLRVWLLDAHNAARLRNGVYLESIESFQEAIDFPKPDQAAATVVSGYVIATMRLRDQEP